MNDVERNKVLVREFWGAANEDKMDFVADDACWHLPTSVARRGFDQDVRGEAVRALFLGSSERYDRDRTWDVHHVVAAAERALLGQRPEPSVFEAAAREATVTLEPASDLHESAEFRRHLAAVATRRALTTAVARAGGAA